jgi:hypothetical protein
MSNELAKVAQLRAQGNDKPGMSANGRSFIEEAGRIRSLVSKDLFWLFPLVLLNLLFFGDALFSDMTFYARDLSTFHYPLKKLVTESYANGEWPLWNPFIQMGQPLLANPNSMALYPTQLLFQFLPFETAFELHLILHCILAGAGAFLLARRLGQTLPAAILVALIYNFSGVTLSCVNLFNVLPAVAFLPLLSLAFLEAVTRPSPVSLTLAGGLTGCFLLLLEPLSSLAIGLFVLLVLAFSPQSAGLPRVRSVAVILVVFLLGLLLASIQIVPTLELLGHSGRHGGLDFEAAAFWSLHPMNFVQLVCPRIFGDFFKLETPTPWATRFFDGREPYLLSCYFGAVPLLMVVWACVSDRTRIRRLLVTTLMMATLLALGRNTPIYGWLCDCFPVIRFGRYPVKFLLVANICVALLAGMGLDRLVSLKTDRFWTVGRTRLFVFCLLLLALGVLLFASSLDSIWTLSGLIQVKAEELHIRYGGEILKISKPLVQDAFKHVQLNIGWLLSILLLWGSGKIRPAVVKASISICILFDLFIGNYWINPLIRSDFFTVAPVSAYLREKADNDGPFRVYRFEPPRLSDHPAILYSTDSGIWLSLFRKLTLYPFLAAKDHVQYSVFPSVDHLETLAVQQLSEDVSRARSLEEKLNLLAGLNVLNILSPLEISTPRLALEALFQVNSDQPLKLYRLLDSSPRAFLLQSEKPGTNLPRSSSGQVKDVPQELPHVLAVSDKVRFKRYSFNKAEMEIDAEHPGRLVLLDNNYPGWLATVDGKDVAIEGFNRIYRAVPVPAGKHRVDFRYEPMSFRYGRWMTLSAGCMWVTILFIHHLWKIRISRRKYATAT